MAKEAHAYIEFYLEAMPDAAASRDAGRPMFKDVEMVSIKLVGDPANNLVARAHEKFQFVSDPRDAAGGRYITYAERYPDHYSAFLRDAQAAEEGTPLEHLPFMTKSQIAEFKAQNIRTVEGLAGLADRLLKGMGWRAMREQAKVWIEEADKMAAVTRVNAENDGLRARLAALEAKIAATPAAPADDIDGWTDDALRAYLEGRGISPRANAAHDKLVAAARDVMAEAA